MSNNKIVRIVGATFLFIGLILFFVWSYKACDNARGKVTCKDGYIHYVYKNKDYARVTDEKCVSITVKE